MASNPTMRPTALTYDRFGSKSTALIKMKKGYDDDKLHQMRWTRKIKSVDPRIATRTLETEIVRIPDDYDVEMVCFAHSEFEEAANYLEFENDNVKEIVKKYRSILPGSLRTVFDSFYHQEVNQNQNLDAFWNAVYYTLKTIIPEDAWDEQLAYFQGSHYHMELYYDLEKDANRFTTICERARWFPGNPNWFGTTNNQLMDEQTKKLLFVRLIPTIMKVKLRADDHKNIKDPTFSYVDLVQRLKDCQLAAQWEEDHARKMHQNRGQGRGFERNSRRG